MDNSVHATGWIYLEISSSTSFKITNNYISHASNGSHPNQTALNFYKKSSVDISQKQLFIFYVKINKK